MEDKLLGREPSLQKPPLSSGNNFKHFSHLIIQNHQFIATIVLVFSSGDKPNIPEIGDTSDHKNIPGAKKAVFPEDTLATTTTGRCIPQVSTI